MINELNIYRKAAIILVCIVIGFVLLFSWKKQSENRLFDRKLKYYMNRSMKESDSIIQSKERRITFLLNHVRILNGRIKDSQSTIDSLERVKSQVEYVYINKIKEIDKFDAKKLEEYWRHEFKD